MHHLMNHHFSVSRRTSYVLDKTALTAPAVADRTPTESYVVEVEVTYVSGALGTIEVSGTSAGVAASETLDFASLLNAAGAARLTTTLRFDRSTAVTFTAAGWGVNPTVVARGSREDGSPLKLLYVLHANWPGRVDRRRMSWGLPREGGVQHESPVIFLVYSEIYTPREGDELVDASSGLRYRVEGEPEIDGFSSTHHWECNAALQQAG